MINSKCIRDLIEAIDEPIQVLEEDIVGSSTQRRNREGLLNSDVKFEQKKIKKKLITYFKVFMTKDTIKHSKNTKNKLENMFVT